MFDLAIIGAGPAGLSASVYASRYGIKNIVIGEISGGLPTEAHEIGNWLGTPNITGADFAVRSVEHAKSYGAEMVSCKVDLIEKKQDAFRINLANGNTIETRAVLLAMGNKHRKLGIPGEKEFAGKGVSYCAICDGFFYKNKTVAVIGGNDSAVQAALYLSDLAKKVFIVYRGEKLRCEIYWSSKLINRSNVEIILSTNIKEIMGSQKVESVELDNPHQESSRLAVDGVFIEIGLAPSAELVKNLAIELDEEGYVRIDADGKTTEQGVWAAGDITTGSNKLKQIVTAAAEGAIAAQSISQFLKN